MNPSHSTRPFISLQNISLRLYGKIMFAHTSWEILDDQQWAIVGPNGSGKSTLMRALCGQVPVVEGQIAYPFFDPGENGSLPQDRIAYVSFASQKRVLAHESPFYQARWNSTESDQAISVSEYLSEGSVHRINPYQVIERSSDPAAFEAHRENVIEQLRIGTLLTKNVLQLSNGEMRKVLIARALLQDPRLLILDNPFTGLDAAFRARLQEVLEHLMQGSMRLMIVTNHIDEVPPAVTHVLQVNRCQVVDQGRLQSTVEFRRPQVLASPIIEFVTGQTAHQAPASQAEDSNRAVVHMRDVQVSYNGTKALQHIRWTVRRGENWALLGPNGAGKTTLLSLIMGDHPQAYANDITLFGKRRGSGESIWEIKQRIGWVSSELHLYYPPRVSCLDVVCSGFFDSIGLYRQCSARQREAARSWMQQVHVWNHATLPFKELSEGEQRLILIARAMVKRPPLLILDEPCQGLDPENRDRVIEIVEEIDRHAHTSLIYVTHRPDELPGTITHVLRLDRGRIQEQGRITRATRANGVPTVKRGE